MCLRDTLLCCADCALSLLVFFPLAILHWRGTWELQDVYFLPSSPIDSRWISLAIGTNLGLVGLLLQPVLANNLPREWKLLSAVFVRLHLYIHGWAIMCFWRGVWDLLDLYLGVFWFNSVVILVVCQVISFMIRTVRTNVGIPVAIALDTDPDLLQVDTVFKVDPEHAVYHLLDCLFTQFIAISCSIGIWRGIWNIIDIFLLPRHHHMSDLISLGIGYLCIVSLLLLQRPLACISAKLDKHPPIWKIVYEDVIFFIATIGNLFLWRGAWDLCVTYFIPDPFWGSWASHIIGTVCLMALQLFNNVGLNGLERDGQYPAGEGIFPIYYLRTFYDQKAYHRVDSDASLASDEEECTKPLATDDSPNVQIYKDVDSAVMTDDEESFPRPRHLSNHFPDSAENEENQNGGFGCR